MNRERGAYPFFRIQVQILHLAMLEIRSQPDTVICYVGLFSDNHDLIFLAL
jgi:hypothetical protein